LFVFFIARQTANSQNGHDEIQMMQYNTIGRMGRKKPDDAQK
jgi:hypothetical protein